LCVPVWRCDAQRKNPGLVLKSRTRTTIKFCSKNKKRHVENPNLVNAYILQR
jgi:hypothetical protein